MQLPFFVYGTLRPGERNYNTFLTHANATAVDATLSGYVMHDYGPFPYILAGEGDVVGTMLTVADDLYADMLESLDQLEGFISEGHPHNEYNRIEADVIVEGGTAAHAWVYVAASDDVRALPQILSGNWLTRAVKL